MTCGLVSASWLVSAAWLALVAGAAASIVGGTLRTGIAPMPGSRRACRAMVDAIDGAPDGPVLDLGSGWGTLAIRAARAHPHRPVIGYELSFVPWLVASIAARALRLRNLSFRRRDFREARLHEAAVLLCFLFPDGMRRLARCLADAPRRPPLIFSNTFALPAAIAAGAAVDCVRLADFRRTRIHVYRFAR